MQEGTKDTLRGVLGKNVTVSRLKSLGEEVDFCSYLVFDFFICSSVTCMG